MIINALKQHARVQPERVALNDGTQTVTYRSLMAHVTEVADWLVQEDIAVLGIGIENSIDWIIADLAAMAAGITSVPVPAFFSEAQVAHVLNTALVDTLIVPNGDARLPGLLAADYQRLRASNSLRTSNNKPSPSKITFTSGSTGSPRGAVLANETIEKVAGGIVAALADIPIERHLCLLPLATLLENIAGVYAPLIKGIEVCVPSPAETGLTGSSGLDANQMAICLNHYQPQSLILVPQLAMALVSMAEFELLHPEWLLMAAVGGGKVSDDLLTRAAAVNLPLYEGYGLTEAGSVCSLNLPGANKPGTAGQLLPHVEARLSESGELLIKGSLMQGYLDSTTPMQEWLPTGDLATMDEEGFITIVGRIKNTFITAFGRNINPEWVEAALTQQLLIEQAVLLGEGRATNLALLWLRFEPEQGVLESIIAHINEQLPDYAQIHDVLLIEGSMPKTLLTPNGRIRRAAVLSHYANRIDTHYASAERQSETATTV